MSIHVMNLVWKKAPCNGNTLLALLALADWSDDKGKSWPAIETLAIKSRQSERNCRIVVRSLESQGLLAVKHRPESSNEFQINLQMLEGQSLPPAKKSNRGGLRGKSLPNSAEMFAPNTSINHTSQTKQPSDNPFIFELTSPEPETNSRAKPKPIPDWVPLDAWDGYVDMRKSMKFPMTDHAKNLELKELEKLKIHGYDPREVLEQSIRKCYRGLFKVNIQNGHQEEPEDDLKKLRQKEAARRGAQQ